MASPAPSQYALGRNTNFMIQAQNVNEATGGTPALGPWWTVCIQNGNISLSANVISILNNCNYGWEVKLPGTKSGTLTMSGHSATNNGGASVDMFPRFGTLVNFSCIVLDSLGNQAIKFLAAGVVTQVDVAMDVNDSVNVDMTIEISGAPDSTSSILMADPM